MSETQRKVKNHARDQAVSATVSGSSGKRQGGRGGEGIPIQIWLGVYGPLPKTLTLFMTNICNILYPIYDLTKNSKPYL